MNREHRNNVKTSVIFVIGSRIETRNMFAEQIN